MGLPDLNSVRRYFAEPHILHKMCVLKLLGHQRRRHIKLRLLVSAISIYPLQLQLLFTQ
jgi:hypothetical protein